MLHKDFRELIVLLEFYDSLTLIVLFSFVCLEANKQQLLLLNF